MKSIVTAAGLVILMGFSNYQAVRAQATFVKHAIATIGQPMDVTSGDLNGDGHTDLATVSVTEGEVAWWENNRQGGYIKRQIRTGFTGGRSIRAGDIDGDGDNDLIAASITLNRIEWYENDGSGKFTTITADNNFRGAHTVQITDLDRDGDQDILCSGWDNSASLSEVAWWENQGNKTFAKHVVSALLDQSPFVEAADMDLDGDLDLIGSDETPGEVYWWENNGSQVFTQHVIDNQFTLAHTVLARDIDKDGDPDILASATSSSLLAWYENAGAGIFKKHAMDNLGGAIWLDMADFDLDGDQDMLGTGMSATQPALYTNNGRQVFAKSQLSGGLTSGFALNITDLDHDGDADVVAIGYNSNFLGWWENTTDHTALIKSPSWLVPGLATGDFLVVNSILGNIIASAGNEPARGLANPGYCQGIALSDNLLYVNSGASLQVFHPESGVWQASYRVDAQFLEGLTATPTGQIYLSAPEDGTIFSFDPGTGIVNTVATALEYPRALRYDAHTGEILVLDGEELITVKSVNPASGDITTLQVTTIAAGGDIETDGAGNYYLSSPSANSIFVNTSGWISPAMEYRTGLQGPWGLSYDGGSKELIVAMNGANRLERIPATATGISRLPNDQLMTFSAWPNPFIDRIRLKIPANTPDCLLQLMSSEGRLLWSRKVSATFAHAGSSELEIDLRELMPVAAGAYYLVYSDGLRTETVVMVH